MKIIKLYSIFVLLTCYSINAFGTSQKIIDEYNGYYNWLNELLSSGDESLSLSQNNCKNELKNLKDTFEGNGIHPFKDFKEQLKNMAIQTEQISDLNKNIEVFSPSDDSKCKNSVEREKFREENCKAENDEISAENDEIPAESVYCKCRNDIFTKNDLKKDAPFLKNAGLSADDTILINEIKNKPKVDECIKDFKLSEQIKDSKITKQTKNDALGINEQYNICKNEHNSVLEAMKSRFSLKNMVLSDNTELDLIKKMQEFKDKFKIKEFKDVLSVQIKNVDDNCLRKNQDSEYIESISKILPPGDDTPNICKDAYNDKIETNPEIKIISEIKENILSAPLEVNDEIWEKNLDPSAASADASFKYPSTEVKNGFWANKYSHWQDRVEKNQRLKKFASSEAYHDLAVKCGISGALSFRDESVNKKCEDDINFIPPEECDSSLVDEAGTPTIIQTEIMVMILSMMILLKSITFEIILIK